MKKAKWFSSMTKKALALALSLCMAIPGAITGAGMAVFADDASDETPTETKNNLICGDVTQEGNVTADDALAVLKHAAQITPLSDDVLKNAELTDDVNITSADALEILKIAAQLRPKAALEWDYTKDADGNATLIRYNGSATEVEIPAKINGLPVVALGTGNYPIFCSADKAKDDFSWWGAPDGPAVTKVTIPSSVTKIDKYAFMFASALEDITIPASVVEIGEQSFYTCGIKSVTIEGNPTTYGKQIFEACPNLASASFTGDVTTLGDRMFAKVPALKEVTFTSKTAPTYAGEEGKLFQNTEGCTIYVPEGSRADYKAALSAELQSGKVKVVDGTEFEYTVADDKVTITRYNDDDPVVSIPAEIGGKPVVAIGTGSYPIFCSADKAKDDFSWWGAPDGPAVTKVTIPSSVTKIDKYAFMFASALEDITIPASVVEIGEQSFYTCGIKSVTIEGNPTTYGKQIFEACPNLASANFTGDVTTLGDRMFAKVPALKDVTFTSKTAPTYVGEEGKLFQNNTDCTIHVPEGTRADYKAALSAELQKGQIIVVDGTEFDYTVADEQVTITRYKADDTVIKIPAEIEGKPVVAIGTGTYPFICAEDKAKDDFSWWGAPGGPAVTKVIIPDSVTKIDKYAFMFASALEDITIPASVVEIGEQSFYTCGIKSVTIEGNPTTYGKQIFEACPNLASANFTGDVTTLGDRMFAKVPTLKDVTFTTKTPPTYVGEEGKLFQNNTDCTIHVPKDTAAAYEAALSAELQKGSVKIVDDVVEAE